MDQFKDWIQKSILPQSGKEEKAWCTLCKTEIQANLAKLKDHVKATRHAKAVEARCIQRPVSSSFPKISTSAETRRVQVELRLALHTALVSTFRGVDPLCDILNQELNLGLKLHRTKCEILIKKVLGPFFRSELVQDLQSSHTYGILMDESTDVSVTKLLAFSVRYFSERFKTVKESFLSLTPIVEADHQALFTELVRVTESMKLDPDKLYGLSTDGCNVMVGRNNSVMTLAKKKFKNMTHLKCVAHSLDLVAKGAMETMSANLEFMLRESYNFFAHSSLRQAEYRSVLELVGFSNLGGDEDPGSDIPEENQKNNFLKLISPSQTRWLVLADCNQRILKQYDALTAMFDMARLKIKDKTVRDLADLFKDQRHRSLMIFLNPVLSDLRRLTLLFQNKKADNLIIYQELEEFFVGIARRIIKNSVMRVNDSKSLCQVRLTEFLLLDKKDADLGDSFLKFIGKLSRDVQEELMSRAMDFLKELFVGLQKRLVEALELVKELQPFTIEKMKVSPPKVSDCKSPFFSQDPVSLTILEGQLRQITNLISDDDTTSSFWITMRYLEVAGKRKMLELADGVTKMLSLPVSNAGPERTFSATNYYKSDGRSRMSTELLENILLCKFGILWMDSSVSSFIPPSAVIYRALELSRKDYQ